MTRRQKKMCIKGKRINSTARRTKMSAESELFETRFSKKSKRKLKYDHG